MGAVPRLENGWASGSWGFDSLSFRNRGEPTRVPARPLLRSHDIDDRASAPSRAKPGSAGNAICLSADMFVPV